MVVRKNRLVALILCTGRFFHVLHTSYGKSKYRAHVFLLFLSLSIFYQWMNDITGKTCTVFSARSIVIIARSHHFCPNNGILLNKKAMSSSFLKLSITFFHYYLFIPFVVRFHESHSELPTANRVHLSLFFFSCTAVAKHVINELKVNRFSRFFFFFLVYSHRWYRSNFCGHGICSHWSMIVECHHPGCLWTCWFPFRLIFHVCKWKYDVCRSNKPTLPAEKKSNEALFIVHAKSNNTASLCSSRH